METFVSALDWIGANGHILLFAGTVVMLWRRWKYVVALVCTITTLYCLNLGPPPSSLNLWGEFPGESVWSSLWYLVRVVPDSHVESCVGLFIALLVMYSRGKVFPDYQLGISACIGIVIAEISIRLLEKSISTKVDKWYPT